MPIVRTNILLIEDAPGEARLLQEALWEIPECAFQVEPCKTLAEAMESLENSTPDVVLCDLALPDTQELEAVRRIRSFAPEVPIVVLTGVDDESLALEALKAGAQDYLSKQKIDAASLWRAVRYAMERHRVHLEALGLALIDELTGLNSRRGFLSQARHHAKLAYRTGRPFLLAFVDLDGLKRINDTFGHQEGNRALVDAANVLRDSFRQSDIVARLGGDEFAALIADTTRVCADTIVRRVQRKTEALNAAPGRRYELSLSIGIVAADVTQSADLEQLLSQADALMYQQKQSKRSQQALGTESVAGDS